MANSQENKSKSKEEYPTWVKYMGLSFQLFTVIGLGTLLGWWVQQKSAMKFPVWILVFCFASVILAFYQLWKTMSRDQ
ncbi:AtpZ/AtpI family protein [Algoriphagus sanaruensis]|uniref:ATPase F0F1 n=1 Tax=Algoriphagus sanaruensis TaxID=1727163 RepID=A0A142EIS0_9BACT|nr:AtpZ/AtpI family protein [Algoriphagus sanaruensis]AMQ55025.1 ATPase F0F1 [Algoriphagus sanaruensis]